MSLSPLSAPRHTHTHFISLSHNGSLAAVLICIPLHEREWQNHLVVDCNVQTGSDSSNSDHSGQLLFHSLVGQG